MEQCTNEQTNLEKFNFKFKYAKGDFRNMTPNYHLYSLRVDLFHKKESEELLKKWIDKFKVVKYLCAKEFKKDKTPHYQCAMFFKEHPNSNNARNWWRNKTISSKNGHSFKIAKTPKSLAKYCNDKEKNGLYTNLEKIELIHIGTWEDVKTDTRKFNEKLEEFLTKLSKNSGYTLENNYIDQYGYPGNEFTTEEIINKITNFCYENGRNGLANHHMLNVLRRHNLIENSLYCKMKYPILKYMDAHNYYNK